MLRKKFVIISMLIILSTMLFSSCDGGEEQSFITFFQANKFYAAPGEEILLEWDYLAPNQLENQHLEFTYLNLAGDQTTKSKSLYNYERAHIFTFKKPVTISLVATGEDDRIHKAILTVYQVDQHLSMDIFSITPFLPYLPYNPSENNGGCTNVVVYGTSGNLEFSDLVAFYDRNDNGIADDFMEGGLLNSDGYFQR